MMGFDPMGGEKRRKMGFDPMDSLGDDLVLNILGRLKFSEAAATALASPGLLKVWSFSTLLDFKQDDADPEQQPVLSGIHFMKFVNFILNRHRATSVDSLRIAFDAVGIQEYDLAGSLKKWVEFAKMKSVRSLEIHLAAAGKSDFWFPLYELEGLTTLASLVLKFVSIIDEDDIVYLLETCLVNLETLVIENASNLRNLKIKAKKLKHLSIRCCPDLCSIQIVSAPNLQYLEKASNFQYLEKASDFQHLEKASDFKIDKKVLDEKVLLAKLSSVNLRGLLHPNALLELQKHAPCLEKLELDVCAKQSNFRTRESPEIYPLLGNIPGHFPHLGSIKQLVLNFAITDNDGMMDLMFILVACPNLQDLALNYVEHVYYEPENYRDRHWGKLLSYTHASLTTVTFVGWCGSKNELHFARYLMEFATNLQMITFDTNPAKEQCYMGYREGKSSRSSMMKYFTWQQNLETVQELVGIKPSSVAFRYALLRLPRGVVPTYQDWEERCWMMKPIGLEKCYWIA